MVLLLVSKGGYIFDAGLYGSNLTKLAKTDSTKTEQTIALQTVNLASHSQPHLIMYPYIEMPFYSYAFKLFKHFYAFYCH